MTVKWIDARERQPDTIRRVLLWDPTFHDYENRNPVHIGFWDGGIFNLIDEGGYDGRHIGEVTHWAELPDGPGKEGDI